MSITSFRRPVKAARNLPRRPGRFGAGLLDDDRDPEGVEELERLDSESRPPLPIDEVDWDCLGREVHIQELTEFGYRWC